MRALKFLALAGLLGSAFAAQAAPQTYKLDPGHTMVLFSWNHFGFSNPTANLGLGEGTLVFDQQHPANSSVDVTLPLANLDTHVTRTGRAPEEAGFLRCRQVPGGDLQEHQGAGAGRRQVQGHRQPHRARRDQAGGARCHAEQDGHAADD